MTAKLLSAFVAGLLFGAGLIVGGMTQPAKVIAFLDFTGTWDPSLAFVMGAALAVYAVAFRVITGGRTAPLLASSFAIPTSRELTPRLLLGSSLFGIGWGISGFCPGPGVVAVGSGMTQALIFMPAVVVGMLLFKWSETTRGVEPLAAGESAIFGVPTVEEPTAWQIGPKG